jgi:hypothetical protein
MRRDASGSFGGGGLPPPPPVDTEPSRCARARASGAVGEAPRLPPAWCPRGPWFEPDLSPPWLATTLKHTCRVRLTINAKHPCLFRLFCLTIFRLGLTTRARLPQKDNTKSPSRDSNPGALTADPLTLPLSWGDRCKIGSRREQTSPPPARA